MTIQDFIKQGHKWIELKGVPVRDSHSKSIVFIHNHFFEGKELEFQNELIADLMKHCPDREWHWRVYGGDTPDDDMVGWIYTQTAEIVSGDESVMPASEITETEFSDTLADDLKEGDRVLSRHYGAQATVLGREWDKQRKAWYYRVKFDTMQRHMDGSEFNVTEFHRDGLTKNYDPVTCSERVGNAEYYRETLLAEFWGNDRTPRTVYGMEIFKPTDRRLSWLVVADIFSEPKEMTLREVCNMLADRYQEEQGKAA